MSQLRLPNGDDHPEAAHKHLLDADTLLAHIRPDGAAYLSGYVVECALKSLHLLETGTPPPPIHNLRVLAQQVSALAIVAGARTARYFGQATRGIPTAPIAGWRPEMRYQTPGMSLVEAKKWHDCARDVFHETVLQMKLDGVL